jgi:Lon protease-like protein
LVYYGMRVLPLFLLPQTVVFPGMTIPLYVYEERYKKLVRICMKGEDRRFVIALDRSPSLVSDGLPYPWGMGTFMTILSVDENPDGTYHIITHGRGRCRIEVAREEGVPGLDGTKRSLYHISDLPEPIGRGNPNEEQIAAWDALDMFRDYAGTFFPEEASKKIKNAQPGDLLHQASFICANLQLPSESGQVLLEAETLERRFQLASRFMKERIEAQDRARIDDRQ